MIDLGPVDLVSSAHRMGQQRWFAQRLFEIMGGAVADVPEADVKRMLASHGSVIAWHAQLWHDRIPAIPGITVDSVTRPANDAACAFVAAVATPGDTIHRLVGLYRVALPAALALHAAWRDAIDPLLDAPTCRVLDLILRDERDCREAGEAMLGSLVTSSEQADRAARRRDELEALAVSARAASPAGATARDTARRS